MPSGWLNLFLHNDQVEFNMEVPMKLTDEQYQLVHSQAEVAVKVEHDCSGSVFYLISEHQYQKLRPLLADEDVQSMEPLLADLQPEDWEDAANYKS